MTRLTVRPRTRLMLFSLLAVSAFALPCPAADPATLLPDGTMLVLSLNVKQLLQAPLVRGDEKAFKQMMDEIAKPVEGFGINPRTDVERVVLAVGEQPKSTPTLVLLYGQFDPAKVQGRLRELARERKNDLHVIEDAGAVLFQGRLPRRSLPNPTITPPEHFLVTVLDGSTIAVAADQPVLTEAIAKKAGRKPAVKPRLVELVGKIDPRETLSIVYVPSPEAVTGGPTAGLTTVTGGVTVAEGVKTDLRLDVKDADSAKRLAGEVKDGLTRLKELIPGLGAFQPGIGRKEQEMIKEMIETFKVTTMPDAVAITSTISKELIEKNARKDQ